MKRKTNKGKIKIKPLEENRINLRLFFKQMKEIRVEYAPRIQIMKEYNGILTTEWEEIAKKFGKIFRELLNPQE